MLWNLNENWSICSGNENPEQSFHLSGIPESLAVHADLPCFAHMALEDHLGISWYEKKFSLPELPGGGMRAILRFESADFRCVPSLNGRILGEHTGCSDPFTFDVTEYLHSGENRLTVRISKPYAEPVDGYTLGEVPHRNQIASGITPGSCYNESGITGDVTLEYVPDLRIVDLFPEANAEDGSIRLHLRLHSDRKEAVPVCLRISVCRDPSGGEEASLACEVLLHTGDWEQTVLLNVPQFRLWSTEDPVLYAVSAELAAEDGTRHTCRTRTGFRSFVVGENGYFYLNGKRTLLRCAHTGNCMPLSAHHISRDPELLRKDFLMAKSVGFNCVRFISGPALPMQLDLCDEIGLMVYEEPVASWLTQNGPHAVENYRHGLLTLVQRDRNHPSVTIWGLLNETHSEPPYDEACLAARDALPALRALDTTRLVIFSSGRWDSFADVGSVCNPGKTEWQQLWNGEGMTDLSLPKGPDEIENNFSPMEFGDLHFYPGAVPMDQLNVDRFRAFAKKHRRPVFISESGIGSVLDTISLVRRWEQEGITGFYPDVKMVRAMNDRLTELLKRYDLAKDLPFPSVLMQGSMQNHAFYRTQCLDFLRSNPYICGISLTGLLDHSICGEGLWTLFRQFKPGIADVLQNGFAPLRWCLIPERTDLFAGTPFHVEAVLANEDILRVGSTYTVQAGLLKDGSARDLRTYTFTVTEEDVRNLAIPVFEEDWNTETLEPGVYTFHAELMGGADAAGGDCSFRVCARPRAAGTEPVYTLGLTEADIKTLSSFGLNLQAAGENTDGVVLCGDLSERKDAERLLANGATLVALRAAEDGNTAMELLPEAYRPARVRGGNWLYHRETVLTPNCPVFRRMQTGMVPASQGVGYAPKYFFDAPRGCEPEQTWVFSFETGDPNPTGFLGGFLLGLYHVGKGRLVLNALELLDTCDAAPNAAMTLVDLVEYLQNS